MAGPSAFSGVDVRQLALLVNRAVMWTVSAPARLHFGLIDLSGDHGRIDGGAGVAIESPRVVDTS